MTSFNILKKYPELLDLNLGEKERTDDLLSIFQRDIENNKNFIFRNLRIYPIKSQGDADMGRLFKHLTCESKQIKNEDGTFYTARVFEMDRSKRLHWIKHHINELSPQNVEIFTTEERDDKKRKVKKTYIYDKVEEYIIVLEHQRSVAFYLLTAYHLNKEYGKKSIMKKMKRKI